MCNILESTYAKCITMITEPMKHTGGVGFDDSHLKLENIFPKEKNWENMFKITFTISRWAVLLHSAIIFLTFQREANVSFWLYGSAARTPSSDETVDGTSADAVRWTSCLLCTWTVRRVTRADDSYLDVDPISRALEHVLW